MTHAQFVTFWSGMLGAALKIWYARLKEHIRRYFDRYYRIGRHQPRIIGLANLNWASTITQQLRTEREVIRHV